MGKYCWDRAWHHISPVSSHEVWLCLHNWKRNLKAGTHEAEPLTFRSNITNDQLPVAVRILAPIVDGHEGPLVEALVGRVHGPWSEQYGTRSLGRYQMNFHVATAPSVQRYFRLDMLDETDILAMDLKIEF